MPHVSVIIPTFNRARFVTEAIESVLKQVYANYEIIVVDDGSTDGTRKALTKYFDKIQYVHQENSGVSAARNTGLMHARGKWIAFLDSDDQWMPDYLCEQLAAAAENPGAVAHVANATTVSPDKSRCNLFADTGLLQYFTGDTRLVVQRPLSIIIRHVPWFIQSMIIRRQAILDSGLFDTRLTIAEDLKVIANAAILGPFTFCKKEMVIVNRRVEEIQNLCSQARNTGMNKYIAFGKVYSELLSGVDLSLDERITIRRAMCYNRRALGNCLVVECRKSDARLAYKRSLLYYPTAISLIKYAGTFFPKRLCVKLVRNPHTARCQTPQNN